MADGWRNRYMAPFYALIISFVLVLLLGLLLETDPSTGPAAQQKPTPATQEPATPQPKVIFSAKGAKEFPGSRLTLTHGDEEQPFDALDELPELPVDETFGICAVLDEGWTAVGATRAPNSKYSCWGPFDPKSDETSVLRAERSK